MSKKNKFVTFAALLTLAAGIIYFINKIIFVLANMKITLLNPESLSYEWRFGKIFYTKQGNGKPILLIHDLTSGSSDYEWKLMKNELSKNNTVYTLDLLGCGRSDKPNITYTNYLYVQLITDFVKNIISHRTDVIVTGSSASMILMSCLNDDTIFDKIMLINPDSFVLNNQTPTNKSKILKFIIETPIIGTMIYNICTSRRSMKEIIFDKYISNPAILKNRVIDAYYEAAHLSGAGAKYFFASKKSNYVNFSVTRALREINNSIYILAGEKEEDMNSVVEEYQETNPIIESSFISNCKHLPQLEKPEEVLHYCNIFFH